MFYDLCTAVCTTFILRLVLRSVLRFVLRSVLRLVLSPLFGDRATDIGLLLMALIHA
ncbi:hypothetical protein [Paenibacillus sp. FSL K6-2524]|uniref:hypothetical protein n=1 Tax=Paenibacillus sp. FSL K6-2524 TaxID=2954516 RepID=UPI0030F7593B